MGAFKALERPNVFLTDYVARKRWSVSWEEFETLGISKVTAISGSLPYYPTSSEALPTYSWDSSGSLGTYYPRLAYESYRTSFCSGVLPDGSVSGSYDPSLQTTITVPGARLLSSGSNVLIYSIPRKCFGTQLEMQSVSITGSFGEIKDNEGVLLDTSGSIVGDVIYSKGLVVVRDPDTVELLQGTANETLLFTSNLPIFTYNVNCTVKDSEFNYSYNPSVPEELLTNRYFSPYVTSIGLYNRAGELMAVAKLSKPVKKADSVDTTFRIKLDIS